MNAYEEAVERQRRARADAELADLPLAAPSVPSGGSEDAARKVEGRGGKAERLRLAILSRLSVVGKVGATRVELAGYLGESENTVRPRVWELMKRKAVVQTKARRASPGHEPGAVLILARLEGT